MKQTIKYLLVALSTTVLISCGSDGSDPASDSVVTVVPSETDSTVTPMETTDTTETESTVTPPETTDTTETESNATPTETTDTTPVADGNPNAGVSQIGIFGPPQFLQAECGSVAVNNVEATNTATSPMAVNQLVQGQLVDGSSVLNYDLWQITLDPGNYHLVADMWNANLEKGLVGLEISSLVDTEEEGQAFETLFGYDGRVNSFLTIENPTTLTLKVEPFYDEAMNYVMGIFANGASVPTPRFTRCPPATKIGLNDAQTLELPEEVSADDARWFRMSLSAGVYYIDASMSSAVDDVLMGYGIDLVQKFGDDDAVSSISFDTEFGTSVSTSDQFTVLENAEVWIRIVNVYDTRNIEFTVYQ